MKQVTLIGLACMLFLFSNCNEDDTGATTFGFFTVQADQTTALANGEINSNSLDDYNRMIAQYPNISQINIQEMPGSSDDDVNLLLSRPTTGVSLVPIPPVVPEVKTLMRNL